MPRPLQAVSMSLATLLTVLLAGCNIHGSYPDATEPDAAKLRFSSNLSSATLGIFDAQHCLGQTTGILNNPFLANTSRRVGMLAPKEADSSPYLEISLKPQQPLYIHLNTQGSLTVCGAAFNFTPQKNAQYELTFEASAGNCVAEMNKLETFNGTVTRTPLVIANTGWPSECNGANPMFKGPRPTQPLAPIGRPGANQTLDRVLDAELPNGIPRHP
ncbi:hypothetical protein ACVW0A_005690 [Pseudomonas sp. TE3610]